MVKKKDFMDFIKDETEKPRFRHDFVKKVDKGITAKELRTVLHEWGYTGVRIKDCETVLNFCRVKGMAASQLEPRYQRGSDILHVMNAVQAMQDKLFPGNHAEGVAWNSLKCNTIKVQVVEVLWSDFS